MEIRANFLRGVIGDVDIRRGIFQGDTLSVLLFVLCMVPQILILCEVKACYECDRKQYKGNHLLFMDDLKLFAKSIEQIESPVQTVYVFSRDIRMEFRLKEWCTGSQERKVGKDRWHNRSRWGRQ